MGLKPYTSDFTSPYPKGGQKYQAVDVGWKVEISLGIILDIPEGSKPKTNPSACTVYMRLCFPLDNIPRPWKQEGFSQSPDNLYFVA